MEPESQVSKRATLYARTSQDSEDAGLRISIEEQLAACKKLADQTGYHIIGSYTDRNRSGRTYPTGSPFIDLDPVFEQYFIEHIHNKKCRNRNGLAELFKLLPEIDVILVRDETRLMRPLLNSYLETYIWQKLAVHGVVVHSVAEGIISPANHDHQMISRLKATAKDKDVLNRIHDSKTSLDARRNSGNLYYSPKMLGFESDGHQKVKPIPSELKTVRRIFEMYLDNHTILSICKTLNTEGIPTKTGKGYWCDRIVRTVLGRTRYAGYQVNTIGDLIESQQFKPHTVITLDEFQSVQRLLDKKRKHPRVLKNRIHPLSGLLFCSVCGYGLRIFQTTSPFYNRKVKVHYYICMHGTNTPAGDNPCRKVLIREKSPPQAIKLGVKPNGNGLIEFIHPLLYVGFIRYMIQKKQQPEIVHDADGIRHELHKIAELEKKLLTMNLDNKISNDQFANLMERYNIKRKLLNQRLAEIQEHIEDIQKTFIPVEQFSDITQSNMTPEVMRDLCHKTFRRIEVAPDAVHVFLATGAEFQIERMRIRNSRQLPFWRAYVDDRSITSSTRIEIHYFYKSAITPASDKDLFPRVTVHEDDNLKVVTVGKNSYGSYRKSKLNGSVTNEFSTLTIRNTDQISQKRKDCTQLKTSKSKHQFPSTSK